MISADPVDMTAVNIITIVAYPPSFPGKKKVQIVGLVGASLKKRRVQVATRKISIYCYLEVIQILEVPPDPGNVPQNQHSHHKSYQFYICIYYYLEVLQIQEVAPDPPKCPWYLCIQYIQYVQCNQYLLPRSASDTRGTTRPLDISPGTSMAMPWALLSPWYPKQYINSTYIYQVYETMKLMK